MTRFNNIKRSTSKFEEKLGGLFVSRSYDAPRAHETRRRELKK